MALRFNIASSTGDFSTTVTGARISGNKIAMGGVARKVGNLAATLLLSVKTSGSIVTPIWQASNDGTNWYDVYVANNAAYVGTAAGTGTSVASDRILAAPDGVYAAQFARLSLKITVHDGTTDETYTLGYNFRQLPE